MTVADYIQALQQLPQEADAVCNPFGQRREGLSPWDMAPVQMPDPRLTQIVHRDGAGEYIHCQGEGCVRCASGSPLVTVVVL